MGSTSAPASDPAGRGVPRAVRLVVGLVGACLIGLLLLPGPGGGRPAAAPAAPVAPSGPDPGLLPTEPIRVSGALVAGGAGGMGAAQADAFSEVVRTPDGSCTGWPGRGSGGWTSGLEAGAGFALLDPGSGAVVGAGRLAPGRWADVDPSPAVEQWQCSFGFDVPSAGPLPWYEIQVGDLPVWPVVPDPSAPGRYAGSVNLLVRRADVPGCRPAAATVDPPQVVGTFWSAGIRALCSAGLQVAGLRRACRPVGVGSDHVIAVVDPADPARVYLDRSGPRPGGLPGAGSPVALLVAGGVPCG